MPYLLDTYNIIHAAYAMGGAVSGMTVRSLCQWIVASPHQIRATLVLDGRPKPDEPTENEFPDINFVYSGAGISADKVIAQTVERSGNKKKLTVVTNDKAVALHARRNFANAMSSEAFLNLLIGADRARNAATRAKLPEKKTSPALSEGESQHWLQEFGLKAPPPKPRIPNPQTDALTDEDLKRLMGGEDVKP
jgi:predicted RNA-binding protein with PIN domain